MHVCHKFLTHRKICKNGQAMPQLKAFVNLNKKTCWWMCFSCLLFKLEHYKNYYLYSPWWIFAWEVQKPNETEKHVLILWVWPQTAKMKTTANNEREHLNLTLAWACCSSCSSLSRSVFSILLVSWRVPIISSFFSCSSCWARVFDVAWATGGGQTD